MLFHDGPSSLTATGRAAAMDPATTRGVVERLKRRGLIKVVADRSDRRKVILELKPEGRALIESILPILPRIADATLAPLNVAERFALEFLLAKVTGQDTSGQ